MFTYRKYDKESDFDIVTAIVKAVNKRSGHLYPTEHIGNLGFEYMFGINPWTMVDYVTFICEDGCDIGFIMSGENEYGVVMLESHRHRIKEIIAYYMDKMFEEFQEIKYEANSEDEVLNQALIDLGFENTGVHRFNGFCDLTKMKVLQTLGEGYHYKIVEEADLEERVKLFGMATGGATTTVQYYRDMLASKLYEDALDLMVITDNHEIIAHCTFWYDSDSHIGILEPLACKEEHRRKGIMTAMITYGLHKFYEEGATHFYVSTSGSNIPSSSLYRSIGFKEIGKNYAWKKTK